MLACTSPLTKQPLRATICISLTSVSACTIIAAQLTLHRREKWQVSL
jgi:hypothetical protein